MSLANRKKIPGIVSEYTSSVGNITENEYDELSILLRSPSPRVIKEKIEEAEKRHRKIINTLITSFTRTENGDTNKIVDLLTNSYAEKRLEIDKLEKELKEAIETTK